MSSSSHVLTNLPTTTSTVTVGVFVGVWVTVGVGVLVTHGFSATQKLHVA